MTDAMLTKEPGELKEAHEARLGAADLLLDVHAYVEDFGRAIVPWAVGIGSPCGSTSGRPSI